jgi:hypothetical protein
MPPRGIISDVTLPYTKYVAAGILCLVQSVCRAPCKKAHMELHSPHIRTSTHTYLSEMRVACCVCMCVCVCGWVHACMCMYVCVRVRVRVRACVRVCVCLRACTKASPITEAIEKVSQTCRQSSFTQHYSAAGALFGMHHWMDAKRHNVPLRGDQISVSVWLVLCYHRISFLKPV